MSHPAPILLDRSTPPTIRTLTLLAGLSALTMNIFLPSLPGMAEWFGVPYGLMQLSVALYLALSAALQIVIGPISDRFGRRKVVLGALVAPEEAEAAVELLEPPPQAARMPAAPTTPEAFRKLRRLIA